MKKIIICVLLGVTLSLSACGPTLRIKPGEIPPVEPPSSALTTEAEHHLVAYVNQQGYKPITTGSELRRVKGMVARLSQAAGYPANAFPVHLVDAGDEVNAAAFNGASIVVYKELLNRVPSDDHLATILGHEVGHIIAKHYTDDAEEKSRASAVSVGSSILGSIASVAASAAGYGGVANLAGSATETTTGLVGYGAFVGSFSRTQEYEADHLGLLIMAKAGYNPEAAVEVWGNAEKILGSSGTSVGAFFSTHPASGDRMEALKEAMPFALQYYKPAAPPKQRQVKARGAREG